MCIIPTTHRAKHCENSPRFVDPLKFTTFHRKTKLAFAQTHRSNWQHSHHCEIVNWNSIFDSKHTAILPIPIILHIEMSVYRQSAVNFTSFYFVCTVYTMQFIFIGSVCAMHIAQKQTNIFLRILFWLLFYINIKCAHTHYLLETNT